MKVALCLILWLNMVNGITAHDPDLEFVRNQYEHAATDKKVCETMIALLSNRTESNVHLAYLGACQAIRAKHVKGVWSKLNTFNKGRRNIEQAVKMAPGNIEIRMIRMSVQKNCPAFLGYNDKIDQDRNYLEKHKNKVGSAVLLRMINQLLIE